MSSSGAVPPAADQSGLIANTGIVGPVLEFDWADVEIGVGAYDEGPTGVTVVRFKTRCSAAVDVRGGGPGTASTDLLRLGYPTPFVDAVVFAGGSAYGMETITAVAGALKDDGVRSGAWDNVAIVPGAIIYDFGNRRLNEIYPDKRLAVAALHAARPGVFPLGAQGAGRMAMQGYYFRSFTHSGQGGAFRQQGPTKVAVFTVVNALGAVTGRDGRMVTAHPARSWGRAQKTTELLQRVPASLAPDPGASAAERAFGVPGERNTTVSLVVTNQKLESWALQRLAVQVHTSMARAIQPFSTMFDGDTLFALSTQEVENPELTPLTLGAIASEAMWDAVLASVPDQESPVAPAVPVSVPADLLAAYAGTYRFGPAAELTARAEGGRLLIRSSGTGPVFEFDRETPAAMVPLSTGAFFADGRYKTRIGFTRDPGGRVTGAVLNPGRWGQRGVRS
ncbi:MAG TPA: P1 family peptidase [Alphaproteobacteria bacterium]